MVPPPVWGRLGGGGLVVTVSLRMNTLVKDEAIPMLLRAVVRPTFLTINISDFWRKVLPHPNYCIVAANLRQEDSLEASDLLRRCLSLPEFRTKGSRMGKVILLRSTYLEYYSLDRKIMRLDYYR